MIPDIAKLISLCSSMTGKQKTILTSRSRDINADKFMAQYSMSINACFSTIFLKQNKEKQTNDCTITTNKRLCDFDFNCNAQTVGIPIES